MHINTTPLSHRRLGRCQEVIISMLLAAINSDRGQLFSNMPGRGPPIAGLVRRYSVNHKNHRFESERHRSANIYSKGELRALGGGLDALVTVRFMCGCRVRLPGPRWVPEWMVTPERHSMNTWWWIEMSGNALDMKSPTIDLVNISPLTRTLLESCHYLRNLKETPLSAFCPAQRGRKAKLLLSRRFYTCYCSSNWYVFRRCVFYKRSPVRWY